LLAAQPLVVPQEVIVAKKQPVSSSPNLEATQNVRATRVPEVFVEASRARPGAIRILAEGDSWFAYPKGGIFFGKPSNVIDQLKAIDDDPDLIIRDTSSNGDEAVAMVCGNAKFDLIKRLASDEYDVLLFSGGGNDIVGAYDFDFFLNDYRQGYTALECIRHDRFDRRLMQVQNAYCDLIELASEYSRNRAIRIVTHTYDIAKPIPQGAEFFGGLLKIDGARSWMHPYLMTKGIKDEALQVEIVKTLLGRFRDRLVGLAQSPAYSGRLTVVDTHGTVADDEWLNEIHPTSEGFAKVARKIFDHGLKPLASSPHALPRVIQARAAAKPSGTSKRLATKRTTEQPSTRPKPRKSTRRQRGG
jgi:hypothetical protein